MTSDTIAIVGGGNMGYALAQSYLNLHADASVIVSDPVKAQLDRYQGTSIRTTSDNGEAVRGAEIVVLAVKPQVMREVTEELGSSLENQLIVSIAAGIPLSSLEKWLGTSLPIIRCMPNTPVLVGEGMFGLLANGNVDTKHRQRIESVFESAGKVLWFDSDREIDAVTALSGSGPAYFFRFTEALIEAGKEIGLSSEAAKELALQTCVGAAKMLRNEDQSPTQLRENVTSKGGTTEAALDAMQAENVPANIIRAVHAAFERSIELSQS